MKDAFDYIVIGGGSAGCVVANRLSADPGARVALIEAGPSDRGFPANWKTTVPIGNVFLLPHERYNWNYEFLGDESVDSRRIPCPRGRLLGGCSSVNGTVYMRGTPSDYDGWAALGNDGWSFTDVLPWFKKHENYRAEPSPFHGIGGELDVTLPNSLNPLTDAFVAAAIAAGHARNHDFNGASQEGFGPFELNQRNGTRLSSSRAFLRPVEKRPNLTVLTDTLVERIDFKGTRARGVTVVKAGRRSRLTASAEVVLCGGAINSPQLLMLSGIGASGPLEKHGIPVVSDLPGVGQNLQDHPSVGVAATNPSAESYALTTRNLPRIIASPFRYLAGRSGMLSSNAAEAGGFFRTGPGLPGPDVQLTLLVGLKSSARAMPRIHGLVVIASLLRPMSRGTVELASASPQAKPLLSPMFLRDESDMAALVAGIRETRRILAQAPIASMLGQELTPGPTVVSDEQLRAAIRATIATVYHPVGTCKMGPASDAFAVVDPQLKVHGIEGLRVADASIFPTIVSGNTSAPAMMVGERVAAFIQNRQDQVAASASIGSQPNSAQGARNFHDRRELV